MNNLIEVNIKQLEEVVKQILSRFGLKDSQLNKTIEIKQGLNNIEMISPEYIIFADRGRKAGKMPPVKAIKEWLMNEPGMKIDPDKIDSVAYVIAKSIATNGVKGKLFLDKLIQELYDMIIERIDKNIDELIKETLS